MKVKKFLLILFITSSILACVEPFDIKYKLDKSVLSIEAQITNKGIQKIQLSESQNGKDTKYISISPVKNAKIEIIVNNSEVINFQESALDPGIYFGPIGFVAEIGKKYQLKITRSNGVTYQSDIQQLPTYKSFENSLKKVSQIDEIDETQINQFNTKKTGYHNIYLDFKDETGLGDNYSWTWTLYESNTICKSCGPKLNYRNDPYPGTCTIQSVLNEVFDYYCDSPCWNLYHSNKINIFNDEFSDGNVVKNRFIARIPYYQYNKGALIQIRQQLITKAAYKYQKIILDQNDNSGGLADTPPTAFFSNILPLVPSEELIAGHFNACFLVTNNFWIDRVPFLNRTLLYPIGLLEGRFANPEKPEPGGVAATPPEAPCLESYRSTKIKPDGWVEN